MEDASQDNDIIIPATKKSGNPPSQYDRGVYINGADKPAPDNIDVAAIELNDGVKFKNEVPTASSVTSFTGVLTEWPTVNTPVFKYGACNDMVQRWNDCCNKRQ